MRDILQSYKETKSYTLKQKRVLEKEFVCLEKEMLGEKKVSLARVRFVKDRLQKIEHDIEILNAAISDATYVITWIQTGRMPGSIRGIERRAAYEREVSFESQWLDLLKDKNAVIHELPEEDESVQEMKSDLVNELKEYLTERQLEVFVMLGEGMEQLDIAKALGISKQAVNNIIARGRRAIKESGWIMV